MLHSLRIEETGVPIYVQIRDQMLHALGAKLLRPGEQMPTMREVAVALKVDLNTVRHAYEELEKTGAIVIRRARGTFVADAPPAVDREEKARRVEGLARQAIATVAAAGVNPRDVARLMIQLTAKKGDGK
jgi:GntR family transcriptional regulator